MPLAEIALLHSAGRPDADRGATVGYIGVRMDTGVEQAVRVHRELDVTGQRRPEPSSGYGKGIY